MSIDLITMVRRRLDVSETELLVAVELADAANDYGEGISVGVNRIADCARQHPRTVQRCLKRLRDAGWLEIVAEGGMVGGRGKATTYRINPEWVRGGVLPGFPDFIPQHDPKLKADYEARQRGGVLPGVDKQPRQNDPERVTKPGVKGDTAMSPDPYTPLPSDAREQRPSGSRADSAADPEQLDETFARSHWWNLAREHALHSAGLFGICGPRPATFDDVPSMDPTYARDRLIRACEDARDWALTEHRAHFPLSHAKTTEIANGVLQRVNAVLKQLAPAAFEPRRRVA